MIQGMPRVRKFIGWTLVVIVLALGGSFAWGRLRPATAAQAAALALLGQDHRPVHGRNAWAVYWLLDYDVPEDQLDAVYARERKHMFDWAGTLPRESSTPPSYAPLVAQAYPKLPEIDDDDRAHLCRVTDADCLGKVREHASPLSALLARHAVRLARLRGIAPDAVLWDDTPASPYTPPAFGATHDMQLTAAALDFVEGRQLPALTEVCRNVQVMRQLHAHTNSLIGAMLMVSWTEAAERLFAGMLAEMPADQPMPVACETAFAPVTVADVDMCAPMQRESQWMTAGMASIDPARQTGLRRWWMRPLVDMRGLQRLLAERYAWACQADTRATMLTDHELSAEQQPAARPDVFDSLSDALGSGLSQVSSNYAPYLNRNADYAAGLRATRLLLQARQAGLAPAALRQRLEWQLPALSPGTTRSFRFDPDGRHLRMSYYAPRQRRSDQVWRIAP